MGRAMRVRAGGQGLAAAPVGVLAPPGDRRPIHAEEAGHGRYGFALANQVESPIPSALEFLGSSNGSTHNQLDAPPH